MASLQKQPVRAARLFGMAEALREAADVPLLPSDRAGYGRDVATVRTVLHPVAFAAAWAEGRAMPTEQALAFALAAREPPTKRPMALLTAREQEVVRLVARGLTNHQIAQELTIADRTAERHVGNILGKLGLTSRAQLAVWAVEQALPAGQRG
jgi:DNA-binding NarL/FixJ family response regulator